MSEERTRAEVKTRETGDAARAGRALLWTARISGGLMVAVLAFVMIVNIANPTGEALPSGWEWFGLAMFPLGVFIGYVLAFRWAMVGGITVLACLAAWLIYVEFASGILFIAAIVAAPAVLHVIYAANARQEGSTS